MGVATVRKAKSRRKALGFIQRKRDVLYGGCPGLRSPRGAVRGGRSWPSKGRMLGSVFWWWEGVAENLRPLFTLHCSSSRKVQPRFPMVGKSGPGCAVRVLRSGRPNDNSVVGSGPPATPSQINSCTEAPRSETCALRGPCSCNSQHLSRAQGGAETGGVAIS